MRTHGSREGLGLLQAFAVLGMRLANDEGEDE